MSDWINSLRDRVVEIGGTVGGLTVAVSNELSASRPVELADILQGWLNVAFGAGVSTLVSFGVKEALTYIKNKKTRG